MSKALKEEQVEYLRQAGVAEEKIGALNSEIDAKAAQAEAEKVEFKEETQDEQPEQETKEVETPDFVTKEEVVQPMQVMASQIKQLTEVVQDLASVVQDLQQSDEQKITEKAAGTPQASIMSMIFGDIGSAANSEETEIDGRKSLSKSGPKETQPDNGQFFTVAEAIESAVLKPFEQ